MLKSLPVQLVISVLVAFLIGASLDSSYVRFFFSLSCALKDGLMFVMPAVIFAYIAAAILSLEQRAPLLIASIMGLVLASNMMAVLTSYCVGQVALPWITANKVIQANISGMTIEPLFTLHLPELLSPTTAMISGMFVGLFFSFVKVPAVNATVQAMRHSVTVFLKKAFIPFLPVYVFGFVLKIQKEGNLTLLFENFFQVTLLICALILVYCFALFALGSGLRWGKTVSSIKNMGPAALTGFSTMSSAATMPVTLSATEKNLENPQFAQLIIPSTVNMHLLGDALGIPLLGLAILKLSGLPLPDLQTYLIFAGYFCLAKFSTVAVPGGGVLVLLPVLQSHLGLSPEMTSLLATIYILLDSVFTGANVFANGAFALICHRLLAAVRLVKPVEQSQEIVAPV